MNINVSPDGFVDLGGNNWVSLDRIQQAVLETQNPGLQVNCPEGEPRKRLGLQTVIVNDHRTKKITAQEHLILPSTAGDKCHCECERQHTSVFEHPAFPQAKQTINFAAISGTGGPQHTEDHLPMPSMNWPATNNQKASQKPTSNSGQEHLPLPSTMRKK
jgi:hypothetical protein